MAEDSPHILFVDAYDSFSNNIISLLKTRLNVSVTDIKIDEHIPDLPSYLQSFQAIVIGPGPGHPGNAADVGLINRIWMLGENHVLPILGICLGFQSLVLNFGGAVEPLPEPRHGILRRITSSNKSIFRNVECVESVQYHSLYASVDCFSPCFNFSDACDLEESAAQNIDLEPLAWDLEEDNLFSCEIPEHAKNPKAILMAVKHKRKPFYGLQFHPESICSSEDAQRILDTWWMEAQEWNKHKRPSQLPPVCGEKSSAIVAPRTSGYNVAGGDDLVQALEEAMSETISSPQSQSVCSEDSVEYSDLESLPTTASLQRSVASMNENSEAAPIKFGRTSVINTVLMQNSLTVTRVFETVQIHNGDAVILDSEMHQREVVGTSSIIGIVEPGSVKLEYKIGTNQVNKVQNGISMSLSLQDFDNDIFCYLKAFMEEHKVEQGNTRLPFWGGLVGYISYEACLETIDIYMTDDLDKNTSRKADRPDLSFIFIERSVVINHPNHQIHIQSIKPDDFNWVSSTAKTLSNLEPAVSLQTAGLVPRISHPDPAIYKQKIQSCQDFIRSGDSYELCLTNTVSISTVNVSNPYTLYLRLRSLNAAPFSAYLRLGSMTLLSSSPERFMCWSRPRSLPSSPFTKTSTIQFRPIKGTVKRHPHGPNHPALTLPEATSLLSTPKERAENLMIVDLIRHDLHTVVGAGNVSVPKLMVVEEYATLFQLVTVVEGRLSIPNCSYRGEKEQQKEQPNGISVLARSLPPGSMTGAPKRRSCSLLKGIEKQPRGVYSGVVGYMDVGGGGDFSVCIRGAVRWDDGGSSVESSENERAQGGMKQGKRDTWLVGAGGAITALSNEDAEWEEMGAKLASTLRVFQ